MKKPEFILDREAQLRERIGKSDVVPDLKWHFEELIGRTRDGLTGLQGRGAVDKAVDELFENRVPHAVAMIDFRNLGGLNEKLGHTGADPIIKETIVERLVPAVRSVGGEVYRCGGDEYVAIVPNMKANELNKVLNDVSEKIDNEVIKPRDLENLPHSKNYGLPTGVGIDFGCADNVMSINRHDELKKADRRCFDAKEDQKDIVAAKELSQGRRWVQVEGIYAPEKIANILQTMKRELKYEYGVDQEKTAGSRTYGRGSDTRRSPEAGIGIGGSGLDRASARAAEISSGIGAQEGRIPQETQRPTLGSIVANGLRERAVFDGIAMAESKYLGIQTGIDSGKVKADDVWKAYERNVERVRTPEKGMDI